MTARRGTDRRPSGIDRMTHPAVPQRHDDVCRLGTVRPGVGEPLGSIPRRSDWVLSLVSAFRETAAGCGMGQWDERMTTPPFFHRTPPNRSPKQTFTE